MVVFFLIQCRTQDLNGDHFQKRASADPARTGAPASLAIHDKGLATIINPINRDSTGKPLTSVMKNTA